MATTPVTPQGQGAPDQGAPQANPLQQALAQLAKVCEQIGQQNPIVQAEMAQARQACIQGLQKTMLASQPQAQESPDPQAEG